jgi:hypothetical protein
MSDHIVEEVRRIREEHAAKFNYDIAAIVADINKSAAERDWPVASFAPPVIQRPLIAVSSSESSTLRTATGMALPD